ncbi:Polyadenylate-binding protein-interacting protein 6 [Hirschfeldia incana]|nr:Polyadenylate-binding protein-interacting protein 6 [Hirschfeldia incana]
MYWYCEFETVNAPSLRYIKKSIIESCDRLSIFFNASLIVFFFCTNTLAMKPGGSALNPHAAAYIPLSKREGASAKPAATTHHHVQYQPCGASYGYDGVQGMGSFPGSQMYMPTKTTTTYSSDKKMRDEDLEMDMEFEYLLATFSALSQESINDVYLANNGDLDATIEMLNQLEIYSTEAQEYLPDTLDIGDVPETTTPSSAPEQTIVSNEASSSSTSSGTLKAHVSSLLIR